MLCLLSHVQVPDSERTTYSRFKRSIKRKLAARAAVVSSPVVTRWQQPHRRGGARERRRACCLTHLCPAGEPPLVSTPGKAPGQTACEGMAHSGIRDLGDNLDRGVSVRCSLFLPVPWLSGALGVGAVCADFHRQSKLRATVLWAGAHGCHGRKAGPKVTVTSVQTA